MVKKININSKEKNTNYFTINFTAPTKHHVFTLKNVKKWLENSIKVNNKENNIADKIKQSISNEDILKISIDKKINFPKKKLTTLVKKFLKIKGAKYYRISSTSPNEFSVILVKQSRILLKLFHYYLI